jgi:hypothetical protein
MHNAAFKAAAEAFVECASSATSERRAYYRVAAECFVESGNSAEAAGLYTVTQDYDLAAQRYHDIGMFDEAARAIRHHRQRTLSTKLCLRAVCISSTSLTTWRT